MAKIQVYPKRDDLPPHPIDGKLAAGGGLWTADQYTFRLIRDGDISETPPEPPEDSGDPLRTGAGEDKPLDKPKAKSPR